MKQPYIYQNYAPSRRTLLIMGSTLGAACIPAIAKIAGWPSKSIRIVCTQAPGSSTDSTARAIADHFANNLGVPVIIENKPGAVGMIAAETVAKAAADGYTLLMSPQSQLAQAPILLKNPPIDPDKDLIPIGSFGVGPATAAVHKSFPASTLVEVIAYGRAHPINTGNYALGSPWQLQLAQLTKDTGAQFNLIPYKGTTPMAADLYAGTLQMAAGSLVGMGPGIQDGTTKPIVIFLGGRSKRLPGVPSWADAGFKGPAFDDLVESNMLFAPAQTAPGIIAELAKLIRTSIDESPRVRTVRDNLGAEDIPLTGTELKESIARTWSTYRRMTRELGFTPE